MEFRSLRSEELEAWANHCVSVFTQDTREYFLAHYNNDPWRDPNGIFVAEDGGRIVSTVRVFRRRVWLFGAEVGMGGIGEVSTNKDYQGRGLAGKLLNIAADYMAREGLAVSLLFAGAHDFYRRFGWDCLPKRDCLFSGPCALPCEGRAMRPEDLPAMAQVDAADEMTNWRVVRSEPEYWRTWMPAGLGRCAVAVEGNKIVAWLAYWLQDDLWHVNDFRALPGFGHKFDALCALVAELEGRHGQKYTAPAWYPTGNTAMETNRLMYSMVRLITPFEAGGHTIDSTRKLIEASGECQDSNLDHF